MSALTIGILLISSFSAISIVLGIILFDSIKNKKPLGRQIPYPPEKLRPNAHHRRTRNK